MGSRRRPDIDFIFGLAPRELGRARLIFRVGQAEFWSLGGTSHTFGGKVKSEANVILVGPINQYVKI